MTEKPECKLIGTDGNVFAIIGTVCETLRKHNLSDKAKKFQAKALKCESYDEVLRLLQDYVEPI